VPLAGIYDFRTAVVTIAHRGLVPSDALHQSEQVAGCHNSTHLIVPSNFTIIPLPLAAEIPRAQPVEKRRQFLRDNRLSNRVFKSLHHQNQLAKRV